MLDLPLNPEPKQRPRVLRSGRVYTPDQAAFQTAFWALLPREVRGVQFAGEVAVRMQFWRRGRSADGDNLEKAVSDALVVCGILVDDRLIRRCEWEIVEHGPSVRPRVVVSVEPYAP